VLPFCRSGDVLPFTAGRRLYPYLFDIIIVPAHTKRSYRMDPYVVVSLFPRTIPDFADRLA
jgi:hypothetical protein